MPQRQDIIYRMMTIKNLHSSLTYNYVAKHQCDRKNKKMKGNHKRSKFKTKTDH